MQISKVFAAAISAALVSGIMMAPPAAPWLAGLSIDLSLAARNVIGADPIAGDTVAVLALDEETYRRAPFANTPRAAWTPHLGEVVKSLLNAGATVIGQDIILPTSLEKQAPGLDQPYLEALAQGAASGRLVLGAVRHQGAAIEPHPTYRFVVRGDDNIRYLNIAPDADGIIRTSSPKIGDGDWSFAAELARRAGEPITDLKSLINFRGDGGSPPVYSLADIYACDDEAFLRHAFAGKIVLIGAILDIEDRKSTSARFLSRTDAAAFGERCVYPVMEEVYGDSVARTSIPGVMIHAQIVADMISGAGLRSVPWAIERGAIWAVAFAAALLSLFARLRSVVMVMPLMCAAITGGAFVLLAAGVVFGALQALLACLLSGVLAYVYRFVVSDRDKRQLQRSFSKYLSPTVVEQLAQSGIPPALGGERRVVTIWFSDLANFTTISQSMAPDELVRALNEYLSVVTGAITRRGGMIDKYIGDAVVGVFGAPLDDPDHPAQGLAAARDCLERLESLRASKPEWPATRIGMHTGEVLVGNIGSDLRLDYTVMGDAVNLAARLESLNKRYGSHFIASSDVVEPGGNAGLRHIDTVQVKGRSAPTQIYALAQPLEEAQLPRFEKARKALEDGAFAEAAALFSRLADRDVISQRLAEIAKTYSQDSSIDWKGYTVMESK